MTRLVCCSFALLILFLAENSRGHFTGHGHVHTLWEKQQVFSNPDCRSTDTCDLKRFALTTSIFEVWFGDAPRYPTYGNGAIIEYETASVDAIENYAVVQFKKGCVFYSSRNGKGRIERTVSDTVPSFGEDVPFCFPQWVIDSQDTDPAYNSDPERGRFHWLRWNTPGSYDNRSQSYYGAKKPKTPIVYMADYPAGAFMTGIDVRNVSLEFMTCIFKAHDVPAETRREDVNFADPIACFEWQNVYVYDFNRGIFRTDLKTIPDWGEPAALLDVDVAALLISLLIVFALLVFARIRGLLARRRARSIEPPG